MNVRLIFTLLSAVLWPITECSPKCLCMRLFHHYVKTTSYLLSLGQYRRAEPWIKNPRKSPTRKNPTNRKG